MNAVVGGNFCGLWCVDSKNASTQIPSRFTVVLAKLRSPASRAVYFCAHKGVCSNSFSELHPPQLCCLVRPFSGFLHRGPVHCIRIRALYYVRGSSSCLPRDGCIPLVRRAVLAFARSERARCDNALSSVYNTCNCYHRRMNSAYSCIYAIWWSRSCASVFAGSYSRNSSSIVGLASIRFCETRPGHNAFILALSSVSSSRIRPLASILPTSIPGR